EIERRVVHRPLFAPPHEHRPPRRLHVVPAVEAQQRQDVGEAAGLVGVHGQTCAFEHTAEENHVADEGVPDNNVGGGHRAPARISSTSFAAPPPFKAATSSWYLSSAPHVRSTC